MLNHKQVHNFLKIEIVESIFSEHSGIKLETNDKNIIGILPTVYKSGNTPISNKMVQEEVTMNQIMKK